MDIPLHEGGPNWEIFNPKGIFKNIFLCVFIFYDYKFDESFHISKGNRFYLANSLGPGWQDSKSTVSMDIDLETLIEFEWDVNSKEVRFTIY